MSHQKVYPRRYFVKKNLTEEDIDINYFNCLICLQEVFWLDSKINIGEHSHTLEI